jgi:hypothetical protein
MSQNFLVDPEVLEAILAEAAPSPAAGPRDRAGLGILTGGLLDAGRPSPPSSSTGLAAFPR